MLREYNAFCSLLVARFPTFIGEFSADDAWEFKELEDAITKTYF